MIGTYLAHLAPFQSIRNVCEDQEVYKFAYINNDAAASVFQGDKLLLIQAPSGTDIHVNQPTIVRFLARIHVDDNRVLCSMAM